jgi:midasin (ATPase involved in ribosome maturation)
MATAGDGTGAGRKALPPQLRTMWREFEASLDVFDAQREQVQHGFAFAFVEGTLVQVCLT